MSSTPPPAAGSLHSGAAFASIAAAVLRQATNFAGVCDAELRPRFLNAAGREMVGLAPDTDIAAYELADFFPAKHRSFVETISLPVILQEGRWEGELRLRHFTDPTKETGVRWSAFALYDEGGCPIGAAAFANAISTRRQAEMAFRDQRILLASVLDHLPLGVGVYDAKGELVHSNQCMRDYTGLTRLPSRQVASARRWRGFDAEGHPIAAAKNPGARALRGEVVSPGIDFLYGRQDEPDRWMRVSAVPFRGEENEPNQAIVVVQDVDDLKRATERIEAAGAEFARQSRFLEATLSSIPDFVYAFDPDRRFAYANPAMLALFGLPASEVLGRTFADLDYPPDLAERLNTHIDQVLRDGATVEDEVFYRSPTGFEAHLAYLWGPVHADDGTIELVVGVSRDTSERRAIEEELKTNEARLRAATELVRLGIYSWDPVSGALEWDDRLRSMWGLPRDTPVTMDVFEAGIHPDDLARVHEAIDACVDPAGDGRYSIEYRVIGREDGATRNISTLGLTTFLGGKAVFFIGAAIDVSAQRQNEAAIRASEAQFRSFADHSSTLMWIVDPAAGKIIYRSAAFERIWGVPREEGPVSLIAWMKNVHADDRQQVERALASVQGGEITRFEYRILRPVDGAVRWLRDTSFPIRDEHGSVDRIGGITEDLTQADGRHVYVVSTRAAEARHLAALVREVGYRARTFPSAAAFLDIAPVLSPGCVLVDLRRELTAGLSVPRELKARSIALPTIALGGTAANVASAVSAMKAGAINYLTVGDQDSFRVKLASAMADSQGSISLTTRDETAVARLARLTPREREVLIGLVDGGTNKTIAQHLGISPRTVELHRAQVMNRLDASSLTEVLKIALSAGIASPGSTARKTRDAPE